MADYSKDEIKRIEEKWRKEWEKRGIYKVSEDTSKPKYYVLDMFPYPSGAGLHVGHPLGYIASDIVARYKRLKGFNVLHPMGFDAFGLPAEQYAIQTGQHPAVTTAKNIETYKRQLKQIGFSYDWDREVQTSDPNFYKWTQWIFMQLFNSFYNKNTNRAEPISKLILEFEKNGNAHVNAACNEDTPSFTGMHWKALDEKGREHILQHYRIAYQSETMVNWCPALGTVLSNDEVKDGVSERGGYPVERIKMLQWSMRISAYAERLLNGLDTIDWPEPVKEMQRNWIGKSVGCELEFKIENSEYTIPVFTTRIDTIYGVTFMVIAPEHELVEKITTPEQRDEVMKYVEVTKNRSERERMSEVKRISGVFTGAYVNNPFNNEHVPVWIADYVLAGYGTGAVMAVPSSDTRDYAFAKHFGLPILDVLEGPTSDITKDNFEPKSGTMINSDFLNGLKWDEAIEKALQKVEDLRIGTRKINYRMRDAIFGRQRYWGEPFPVYYKNGIPKLVAKEDLPITLPEIDEYKPTETGEPPLARAKDWRYRPSLTPYLSAGRQTSSEERGLASSSESDERRNSSSSLSHSENDEHQNFSSSPSPLEKGSGDEAQHYQTSSKKYWSILKEYSKENRKESTRAEAVLWEELRNNKLGYKIRRQHAIGIFIADFVCLDRRLVIEVDGEYHLQNKEFDQARTEFLKIEGFQVIRFTNEEVLNFLPKVLSEIKSTLDQSPSMKESSPSPSEKGSGDEASYPFELTTMPGWAGSSWYWFRYMDPNNDSEFCSKEAVLYWKDVDLYIGGSEHATGHLLYSRFWCKALKDLGYVNAEEPFKKMINQGHIQGVSQFIKEVRIDPKIIEKYDGKEVLLCIYKNNSVIKEIKVWINKKGHHQYLSYFANSIELKYKDIETLHLIPTVIHESYANYKYVDLINGHYFLNIERWLSEEEYFPILINDIGYWYWETKKFQGFGDEEILVPIEFETRSEVEKMSKSKYNVVNPDDIVTNYGADTLRMYEMFLGPLELSKPWNTNGIDGVYKFLRKFWNLFHDANGDFRIGTEEPTREELKVLHKTIKKVEDDIDRFSFNTSVSEFMICVNELTSMKCNKRAILEPLLIILAPFAPHITEELWEALGHTDSVLKATYPSYEAHYLVENSFEYPISINGKVRAKMNFALDMPKEDIEKVVLASETVLKWTEGKAPKKIIIVPGRIVNVVM